MAMNAHAPKSTNWLVWGGAAAAIAAVVALGYWFDWFGIGASDATAPAAELAAPVSE